MADIYKTKEIETNINERGVNLGNVDVTLYTMDKGSAAFKIYLKREVDYANEKVYDPVNLYTTDMTPRIDIVAADGSTFAYEPVDVVIPENGVIQYVVSDYVIRHAGKMDVYIYLENESESVQVANFYFYIEEDGVARRLGKEITGGRLEDVVKNVMSGQLMELLSEDFRDQLDRQIKVFLKENNKDFNLKFDDLTRDEKNELMKNLTNQGLADFTIKDNSIGNVKLVDGTITPEKTTFFTKTKTSNLFDLDTLEKSKTVDTNGDVINDDIRWLTGYIPLNSALEEQINFTKGTYRIALYDTNKKFISRAGVTNATYYKPVASTGTKYVRISGVGDYSNIMINKGSSLYPYEPPTKSKEGYKLNPSLYEQFDFKDGIVDTSKIKNQAVTPEKVSFISEDQTNNLVNLATLSRDVSIDVDGKIIDEKGRWLTDYILVDSQLNEQINFNNGTYRVALYDENKKFITRGGAANTTFYKPNSSTFAKYIRLSGTIDPSILMINKGSKLLPYEKPVSLTEKKLVKEYLPIITQDMTDFFETKASSNLFDASKVIKNKTIETDGTIVDDDVRWLSDYILVDSQKDEQINFPDGAYRIGLYGDNKNFITRSGATGTNYKPNPSTFAKYIRISGTQDLDNMTVNKGNSLLEYEDYYPEQTKLKREFVPKPKAEELSIIETKISSNLLDMSKLQLNKTIDTDGNVIDDDIRWLSDYILVDSQLNEQVNFNDGAYRIALYGENKNFITRGGATGTSYKPNPSTFAKYVRISGTINPNELMINKGSSLLPYEKPYGKIMKIKEKYLPTINSLTTDNTASLSQSQLAKIEQNIQTYTPNIPKLDFEEISVGYDEVLNMSKDGTRVYGKTGPMVWVSFDECQTKIPVVKDAGNSIQAVRELDDGELLFSTERDTINQSVNGRICKTRGFNKETGTANSYVNILETPSTQSKVTNSWGMSVYKNIVVASEYGLKTSEGARRVWLSKDYGETFKVIFDQMTSVEKIEGAPTWAGDTAHVHSCAFDPYWNRIWVVTGDHPNSAMYYSDDFGDTWTWVDPGDKPVVQYTGIIALPNCVIFGSDRAPNGVYVYYRGQKSDMPVVEPLLLINDNPTITHVFQLPFKRDWDSLTPVYFSGTGAGGMDYKSVCVATVDGKKAFVLHENEIDAKFGGKCQAFIGPTAQGNVLGAFLDKDISGFRLGKAKAPTWTKL